MKSGFLEKRTPLFALLIASFLLVSPAPGQAQRGGGGGAAAGARQSAPMDLTGYWVSVVSEDWALRMITPPKGRFDQLPLNAEGRTVGNAWDPAKDEAAGEQCRSYGAPAVMRIPGRLHVTWENDSTLRIDTDAGTQTRLFRFGAAATPAGEPTWQGNSVAQWEFGPGGARGSGGAAPAGNLKVVTTNLRPGYVRKNGAPYSKSATVTEYYDIHTLPNGDQRMTVTTIVEDPEYFSRPWITSSDFKKLPDATGWNPTPCTVK